MRLSKISLAGLRSNYAVRDYRGEPVPDALPGEKPFIWAEIEQAARLSKVPWEEFKLQQLAYADWWFGSADAFLWGAWPRDAAVDTRKQAGRQSTALRGASTHSCHVTKRFRILATLKQGNRSMYSNTSGYVHMGLRLDWGKGITGQ